MVDNEIKRLHRLLKELGLYRQFIEYTDENCGKRYKKYCNCIQWYYALSHAFYWAGTPQGHEFWRAISQLWESRGEVDDNFKKKLKKLDLSKNHH